MSDEEENWEAEARERAKKRLQKTPNLKITVDQSPQMKRLQDENQKLKTSIALIAEREFDKKVSEMTEEALKLGLMVPYIEKPEELKALEDKIESEKSRRKAVEKADPVGAGKNATGSAPLPNQYVSSVRSVSTDIENAEFDTEEELIDYLNAVAEGNSPQREEARKTLAKLTRKGIEHQIKTGSEYEFHGDLKKAIKGNAEEKKKWKKTK